MYEEELQKSGLLTNPDATVEQFRQFEDNVFQQFKDSKRMPLSGKGSTIAGNADYIVNSTLSNTFVGKYIATPLLSVGTSIINWDSFGNEYREWQQYFTERKSMYKDMSVVQEVSEMGILMGADFIVFSGLGKVAEVGTNVLWKAGANVLRHLGVAPEVANITAVNIASQMLKSGTQLGATLSMYEGGMQLGRELETTRITELDDEAKTRVFDAGEHGFMTGFVVGNFTGLSSVLMSKINSKMLSKNYVLNKETGSLEIMQNNVPKKVVAINAAGQLTAAVVEGTVFVVGGEYIREGNIDNLTFKSVTEDVLKFLVAIKAQSLGGIINSVKNPYSVNKSYNRDNVKFNKSELDRLGVKTEDELYANLRDKEYVKEIQDSKKVSYITKLKVDLANNGIVYNVKLNIDKTVAETDGNGHWEVASYDKDGGLVDVRRCNTEAEARNLEMAAENINMINKMSEATNLSSEGIDNINAYYEKSPEKLIALTKAVSKNVSATTALDRSAIREFNKMVVKEQQIIKQANEKLQAEKSEAKELQPEKPKEETGKPEVNESVESVESVEYGNAETEGKKEVVETNDGKVVYNKMEVDGETKYTIENYDKNDNLVKRSVVGKELYDSELELATAKAESETAKAQELELAKEKEKAKAKAEKDVDGEDGELALTVARDKVSATISLLMDDIKAGEKIERSRVTNLIKEVNDFIKEVKPRLTPADYKAVLRKVGGISRAATELGKVKKVNAIFKFIAEKDIVGLKREITKEQSKERSDAKDNRRKAIKLVKNKKILFGNRSNEAMQLLRSIDITALTPEQIKQYNEATKEVLAMKDKPSLQTIETFIDKVKEIDYTPKEKEIKRKQDVIDYIDEISQREINNATDLYNAVRTIRKAKRIADDLLRDDKITNEEHNELVEKIDADYNKLNLIKSVEAQAAEVKKATIKRADEKIKGVSLKEGNFENVDAQLIDDIKTLSNNEKVKAEMTLKDAELYEYVVDNLADGFVNGQTHILRRRMADIYKYHKISNPVVRILNTKKFNRLLNKNSSLDFSTTLKNILRSIASSRIAEYFNILDNNLYKSVFFDNIKNIRQSNKFITEISENYLTAYDKLRKEIFRNRAKYNSFRVGTKLNESLTKIAIILEERMWQANGQQDPKDGRVYEPTDMNKPEHMKNYNDAVMEKNMGAGDVSRSNDHKLVSAIWDKIKADENNFNANGTLNIEKVIGDLSKAEYEYMEAYKKTNSELSPYAESLATKHGRIYNERNNYDFIHKIIEKKGGKNKKSDFDVYNSLEEALDIRMSKATKQAGSSYDRNEVPKIIRHDIHNLMKENINDIAEDFFIREDLLSTGRAIEKVGFENENAGALTNAISTVLIDRMKRDLNKDIIADTGLNKIFSWTSKALIGTVERIFKEYPTNVLKNIIQQSLKAGVKTTSNKLIDDAYMDMLDNLVNSRKDYSQFGEHMDEAKTKGGQAIEWVITFSDGKATPAVFESEFNKAFKSITGEKFNLDAYKNSAEYNAKNYDAIQDAMADGIIRAQELFNSKTFLESATHVLYAPLLSKRFILDKNSFFGKTAYLLQSFSHNESRQFIKSVKRIATGEKHEIERGFRDIGGLVTTNYMYMHLGLLISSVLKKVTKDAWDGNGMELQDDFNEGLTAYYDNYLSSEKILKTGVASLAVLAIGKYNYMVSLGGSILLSLTDKEIPMDEETKDALMSIGSGMYIHPFDVNRPKDFGQIHPLVNEMINLVTLFAKDLPDVVVNVSDAAKDKDDLDLLAATTLVNSIIRLVMINPVSNTANTKLKSAMYAIKKDKNDNKDDGKGNRNLRDGKGNRNTPPR